MSLFRTLYQVQKTMIKSFLSVIILITLFVISSTINNLNYADGQSDVMMDAATYCSVVTASKYFQYDKTINVIYEDYYNISVNFFKYLSLNFTFLLVETNDSELLLNYIVISNELFNLYNIFKDYQGSVFSHFLIITQLSADKLIDFAAYLRRQNYVYIAFLVIDKHQKTIKIYQYENDCVNCNKKDLNISCTGYCDFNRLSDINIQGSVRIFDEIVCPINVCNLRFIRVDYGATKLELYDWSDNGTQMAADSYGGCVLNAFAKFYDITITKEDYVSNYNWRNTVKAANDGFVDVCFGPTLPYADRVWHLDKGTSYAFEEFIFIDVLPKTIASLYAFVMPLGREVWICLAIIIVLYYAFLTVFNSCQKKNTTHEKINCLKLVAVFFNQYVRVPRNSGVRYIFSMWVLFSFMMNTIYSSNFISSLIKVKPTNLLKSFDDLRKSGKRFGGPDVAREWLHDPQDPIMMALYNKYEVINPDNISYALHNLKMVVAQTDYVVLKTGMPDFYILSEKIVTYPLLYYIPRRHPFLKFISQFMEHIKAGGVPLPTCITKVNYTTVGEDNAVTMNHLLVVFQILVSCHITSTILFIVEYFINHGLK